MTKRSAEGKKYRERYNLKKHTFDIDKDLHRRFKEVCHNNGETMAQVLNREIRRYIREKGD